MFRIGRLAMKLRVRRFRTPREQVIEELQQASADKLFLSQRE